MRRASIIMITLLLAACGSSQDSKVTETQMDDIDSLEGTISDEMVDTDELNEQPMVEATLAGGAKPKTKTDKPEKSEEKPKDAPKLEADPAVAKGE
jgi:major membrane immunogen (membrane-anchored lipoprotein)